MKTMERMWATAVAIGLVTVSGLRAESAAEIQATHERAKVEALATYLNANPAAEDRAEAVEYLVTALTLLGEDEAKVPWLEERFEVATGETPPNLQVLLVETVQPLLELYLGLGEKEKAGELLERTRTALGPMGENPQIGGFLDHLSGQLDRPVVGDVMEIEFTSTEGKEIDLAAMKGKVVLVDFWATWCGPCVAEMPSVIAAYEKYGERGFEILGISLDENRESLDQFTRQRGMEWPQYFDGKGWENDLVEKFGISSIPATFLIGPDGKIAAMDLRGDALGEAVEGLLGE